MSNLRNIPYSYWQQKSSIAMVDDICHMWHMCIRENKSLKTIMNKTVYLTIIALVALSCDLQKRKEKNTEEITQEQTGPFHGMERENLKETFVGITTSKGKQEGLFPLKSTGVSTLPIKEAGEKFLESFTKQQIKEICFDITDDEWRKWANVSNDVYSRQGISLKEMTGQQKQLALDLMQASLSAKGLQLSKDIMKTDQTLRELNNDDPRFDEEWYSFTLMGSPSMTSPWGWQIDGYHLAINYFILGDQVVMTPTFMGGEPVFTTTGKYKGNTLFQDEQNLGLKFMQSLSPEQQKQATISGYKEQNNLQAKAFSDNKVIHYEGIESGKLTAIQKKALLKLIELYIANIREGHAKIKMEEIQEHIENTYFAWIGNTEENTVFYYRIHSPVVLIEFDHQVPFALKGKGNEPTRNHIHTIVRTPNGNDYGKDYLKQHLAKHHH